MAEVVRLASIQSNPILPPELGMEDQFARQKGLQIGQLKIQKDGIKIDDGSQISMKLTKDGLFAYGSTTQVLRFRSTESGTTDYGKIGFDTGNDAFYIASDNSKGIYIFTTDAETDAVFGAKQDVLIDADRHAYVIADQDVDIRGDYDDSGSGSVYLKGTDSGDANSSGVFLYDHDAAAYVEKAAIVETSKGYRALYCAESPEVWFFDFCRGKRRLKVDGPKFWKWRWEWEVKPDKTFMEVTSPPYVAIPTGIRGIVQLWGKRKGLEKKRFEEKSKMEFEANNKFWSTPQRRAKKG